MDGQNQPSARFLRTRGSSEAPGPTRGPLHLGQGKDQPGRPRSSRQGESRKPGGLRAWACPRRRWQGASPSAPTPGGSPEESQGGYRPYVVLDHAHLWIDMRLVPPVTTELAQELVAKALDEASQAVPGTQGSFTVTGDRAPVERDSDSRLLASLEAASKEATVAAAPIDIFTGYTDRGHGSRYRQLGIFKLWTRQPGSGAQTQRACAGGRPCPGPPGPLAARSRLLPLAACNL